MCRKHQHATWESYSKDSSWSLEARFFTSETLTLKPNSEHKDAKFEADQQSVCQVKRDSHVGGSTTNASFRSHQNNNKTTNSGNSWTICWVYHREISHLQRVKHAAAGDNDALGLLLHWQTTHQRRHLLRGFPLGQLIQALLARPHTRMNDLQEQLPCTHTHTILFFHFCAIR